MRDESDEKKDDGGWTIVLREYGDVCKILRRPFFPPQGSGRSASNEALCEFVRRPFEKEPLFLSELEQSPRGQKEPLFLCFDLLFVTCLCIGVG